MEVAYGADVRVAGIVAADARGVGDHGLELGAEVGFGVGERDGVVVALGHLAAVEPGEFGRGREQDVGLGQDVAAAEGRELFRLLGGGEELVGREVGAGGVWGLTGELAGLLEDGGQLPGRGVGCEDELAGVEAVEAAGDLTGELDVRDLVGADGDEVGLVEQDVGGLKERVAEEAVGAQVFVVQLLLLVLVGGHALEPAEGREHAEERVEAVVLLDVGLAEDDGAAGVEAGGEEVECDLEDVLLHAAGVGVVGGEGVQVGDEEVAVVVVLEADPVVQRTHVVAEVKAAGGSHAGEYTGAWCCAGKMRRAHGFRSFRIPAAGAMPLQVRA